MTGLVKICGLSTPATLEAALVAGADMVGFVRFPRSPRHVGLEVAHDLSRQAEGRAWRVLLVVDPADRDLDEAVGAIAPDLVQLHGSETPGRLAEMRARTGLPVMKALGIAGAADLAAVARYREVADAILLDAKPPHGADRPGGNGAAFDWSLLAGLPRRSAALDPWPDLMLSGGLTPENVADAIGEAGVSAVDISSGVESSPGRKDPDRIAAFIRAARAAFAVRDDMRTIA